MLEKIRKLSPKWVAFYAATFIFAIGQMISILVFAPYGALKAFSVLVPVITLSNASCIKAYFNGEKEYRTIIVGLALMDIIFWVTSIFIHIN